MVQTSSARGVPAVNAVASTTSLEVALAHATQLLEAEPVLAAEQATEILRVVGDHPRALRLLAAAHSRQGDDQAAVGILGPLARACPDWAQAHRDFGGALARLGRSDEAVAALQRATTLQPEAPGAWLALADALGASGDAAGADAAYLRHVQHSAKDPALLLFRQGAVREPPARRRSATARAPAARADRRRRDPHAGRGRGAARPRRRRRALLARCLELAPGFHAARHNYAHGAATRQQATPRRSREVEIAAAPRIRRNPSYRNLKAAVLGRIGDYDAGDRDVRGRCWPSTRGSRRCG